MQRTPPLLTAVTLTLFCLLPGCIAWEIRDEMHQANANLAGANWRLDEAGTRMNLANKNLDSANQRLDTAIDRIEKNHATILELRQVLLATNARLLEVENELIKTGPMMGATNQRLEDLMVLRQVHASLKEIQTTLGPLSKSMSTMGSVVSLLGLGGDAEPAPVAAAPDAGAGGGEAGAPAPAATPAAAAAPAAPATRPPNLLAGTWIMTYPAPPAAASTTQPPQQALVILNAGQYLLAENGKSLTTGTWSQQGKTLTLTPAPPTPAAAPAAGAAAPTPQPIVMEVLNNTPRLLSVRIGNDVRVYTRP